MRAMRTAPRRFDPGLLRLVVVTDGRGDLVRLEPIVRAALVGGARCIQLREPHWSARMLHQACERLLPLVDTVGGVLLVNDRVDVAASRVAHGAQIGHKSLPPVAARGLLGDGGVLGFSAHDQDELAGAAEGGCDFALLSPVWPTESKPGLPHLGEGRAGLMTEAARLPVVWLGGVTVERAERIGSLPRPRRPVGVAVRGAVMHAEDPQRATEALLRACSWARSDPETELLRRPPKDQPNRPDT